MRIVMVRYTVKPGREAENEALVRTVYEELATSPPDGFRYATFVEDDGRSFVHLAAIDDEQENPLNRVRAFAEFQHEIGERCEIPPAVSTLRGVGSLRLLGFDGPAS